jgi:hypothetical protein
VLGIMYDLVKCLVQCNSVFRQSTKLVGGDLGAACHSLSRRYLFWIFFYFVTVDETVCNF